MTDYPHYVLKLADGTVHQGMLGRDIKKTLDKRSDLSPAQVVYEVRLPSGTWVRVWADEVVEVSAEIETHRPQSPSSKATGEDAA